MSSALRFNLDQSKILSSGNGLKPHDKLTSRRWETPERFRAPK